MIANAHDDTDMISVSLARAAALARRKCTHHSWDHTSDMDYTLLFLLYDKCQAILIATLLLTKSFGLLLGHARIPGRASTQMASLLHE